MQRKFWTTFQYKARYLTKTKIVCRWSYGCAKDQRQWVPAFAGMTVCFLAGVTKPVRTPAPAFLFTEQFGFGSPGAPDLVREGPRKGKEGPGPCPLSFTRHAGPKQRCQYRPTPCPARAPEAATPLARRLGERPAKMRVRAFEEAKGDKLSDARAAYRNQEPAPKGAAC